MIWIYGYGYGYGYGPRKGVNYGTLPLPTGKKAKKGIDMNGNFTCIMYTAELLELYNARLISQIVKHL